MDAREIESLSMLSRGFQELRDVNPELAYHVILDILSGINEYVYLPLLFLVSSAHWFSLYGVVSPLPLTYIRHIVTPMFGNT